MADSFVRFTINHDWVDINALISIPIGDQFNIQVTGGSDADASLSVLEPVGNIGDLLAVERFYGVNSGENQLWLRASEVNGTSLVSIRINGFFDPSGDFAPADFSADFSQDI